MMKLNDQDRKLWVENDENLYDWWKAEGGSLGSFVRANREELDRYITAKLTKPKT
jgi:hypothetical protein